MSEPLRQSNDPYETGLALAAQGRHADALSRFEEALQKRPDDGRVLFALGNTARAIGHGAAAESFFRRVLDGDPDRIEALVNLGNLLRESGRCEEAIALLKPAIGRMPHAAELWLTIGSACRELGDTERAIVFYREALHLQPEYAPALGNMADVLADDGEVEEALACYDRVLKREPHNAQARLNRAILYLLRGDLKRGWRDYEYRLKLNKSLRYTHGLPAWKGRKWRKGARLLVTVEQGLGDQIAFASLFPDLAAIAERHEGRVLAEVEPRLVSLFARSFPDIAFHACSVEARGGVRTANYDWLAAAGGADMAIPQASLPGILRRSLDEFPQHAGYLVPDPDSRTEWRSWLAAQGPGPYIGLCWRSGSVHGLRALQYAPLGAWGTFARNAPGTLVALQYDARNEEVAELARLSARTIHVAPALDQKQEIDRTSAMIAGLDGVVSAPTAVSWISAALGVPTYKILYNNSWMSFGTAAEPFAPASRCMMPKNKGDWADCFAQTLRALTPS
jgi:tetratricopeptide (TPR) repeat protein